MRPVRRVMRQVINVANVVLGTLLNETICEKRAVDFVDFDEVDSDDSGSSDEDFDCDTM